MQPSCGDARKVRKRSDSVPSTAAPQVAFNTAGFTPKGCTAVSRLLHAVVTAAAAAGGRGCGIGRQPPRSGSPASTATPMRARCRITAGTIPKGQARRNPDEFRPTRFARDEYGAVPRSPLPARRRHAALQDRHAPDVPPTRRSPVAKRRAPHLRTRGDRDGQRVAIEREGAGRCREALSRRGSYSIRALCAPPRVSPACPARPSVA